MTTHLEVGSPTLYSWFEACKARVTGSQDGYEIAKIVWQSRRMNG
jgi:hypothetical protein